MSINENIRGQAFDTAIEDAIQETTVANGGVSAEFGRFSGGVVNIITKSGGNQFSGSFRESLNNDMWRTLTPFENARLATTPEPRDRQGRTDLRNTRSAGRSCATASGFSRRAACATNHRAARCSAHRPVRIHEEQRRYELKGMYSLPRATGSR